MEDRRTIGIALIIAVIMLFIIAICEVCQVIQGQDSDIRIEAQRFYYPRNM